MQRVSVGLARGISFAAVLLACGRLDTPTPRPVDRALALVRSQDYGPIFDLAGKRIQGYFTEDRITAFLEDVFSLSGKWKALTRSPESYERYLRRRFREHLFNPAEFREILDRIRADYSYTAAAAENRLLAALYRDVRVARPALTLEDFRAEYGRLADTLAPHILRDLGMNAVSIAGGEAASVLVVAALTSAGILGGTTAAGAAGGAATFGVALVAAVVVGVILDATVGEAYEDAARMEIRRHMNELRNRVVDRVYVALERAVRAHVRLQEACVIETYGGHRDDVLAAHR